MNRNCPDCGVQPNQLHLDGCDVERCPSCGFQLISCECQNNFNLPKLKWTGEWPGVEQCRELGWYAMLIPGRGWVSCPAQTPGASEDLNRLYTNATWCKELGKFVITL